eukprot:TRINITY_DN26464_c0_g1_i1.p1 TRINITY_DN26464_c0_g1~~TRINITY_DN26464_c0_g1_i1.p1  ORF type:complete len:411 (+),score=81.22 TRINITY_DN26464_c0_g1_i1:101-1234(+)
MSGIPQPDQGRDDLARVRVTIRSQEDDFLGERKGASGEGGQGIEGEAEGMRVVCDAEKERGALSGSEGAPSEGDRQPVNEQWKSSDGAQLGFSGILLGVPRGDAARTSGTVLVEEERGVVPLGDLPSREEPSGEGAWESARDGVNGNGNSKPQRKHRRKGDYEVIEKEVKELETRARSSSVPEGAASHFNKEPNGEGSGREGSAPTVRSLSLSAKLFLKDIAAKGSVRAKGWGRSVTDVDHDEIARNMAQAWLREASARDPIDGQAGSEGRGGDGEGGAMRSGRESAGQQSDLLVAMVEFSRQQAESMHAALKLLEAHAKRDEKYLAVFQSLAEEQKASSEAQRLTAEALRATAEAQRKMMDAIAANGLKEMREKPE